VDVLKLNSAGGSVWSKWVNTRWAYSTSDLSISPNGDIHVAGTFAGQIDSVGVNTAAFLIRFHL
jgi:hypothetical protein